MRALIFRMLAKLGPSWCEALLFVTMAVSKAMFNTGSNTAPILSAARRYHSQGVIKVCLTIINELMNDRKKLIDTIWRMFMKSTSSSFTRNRNTASISIITVIWSNPTATIALRPTEPIYTHERNSSSANDAIKVN